MSAMTASVFDKPRINDHLSQLRVTARDAVKAFQIRRNEISAQFTKGGASGGSRQIVYEREAAEVIHRDTIAEALGQLRRALVSVSDADEKQIFDHTLRELGVFERQLIEIFAHPHRNSDRLTAALDPFVAGLREHREWRIRQFKIGWDRPAPSEPTNVTHNIVNTGSIIGGFQQGACGSTQHVEVKIDTALIENAVDRFERELSPGASPATDAIRAELATIKLQLKKPTPPKALLIELGKSVRSMVEGGAAGLMAPGALQAAQGLWAALGIG